MSFYIYIFFSFFFFTISFLFLCIMYTSLPIHTVFSFLNRFVCLARFFSDFFRFFASYIFFLFCSVKEGFTIHCVQINILMYLDGNRRKESSIFWEKIKLRVFCMNASFSIKVLAYLNWKWYLRIERQENVLYFFFIKINAMQYLYQHKNMAPKKILRFYFGWLLFCVNGYLSYFQSVSCVNRLRFLCSCLSVG